MLPFGVNTPASVPQRSEILEGLLNYPEYRAFLDVESMSPLSHVTTVIPVTFIARHPV
jgi:hypothetical protein